MSVAISQLSHELSLLSALQLLYTIWGYHGGSPTAVQAWRPCPLWEPSPSHPIVLWDCMCVFIVLLYFVLFAFLGLLYFCSVFFLQYFDTVGWVF